MRYYEWYHASEAPADPGEHARPPDADGIRWADIVAMLEAVGVEVSERSGSRVLLKKGPERMIVHRPHPAPETGRGAVRAIVAFLEAAGVKP